MSALLESLSVITLHTDGYVICYQDLHVQSPACRREAELPGGLELPIPSSPPEEGLPVRAAFRQPPMGAERARMVHEPDTCIMNHEPRHPSPAAFLWQRRVVCVCCVKKFDYPQMHGKTRYA